MLAVGFLFLAQACAGGAALKRKTGPKYEAETGSWYQAIQELGGDGMWIVVRGYHRGDDVIAVATDSPLSHATVFDHSQLEVIEAVGKGVVSKEVEVLLRASHRILLIRPDDWTPETGAQAVKNAREKLGAGYDFLGIIGLPSKKRFYCSELALWSMGIKVDKKGIKHIIHPRHMPLYGDVLFDSGSRDGISDYPLKRNMADEPGGGATPE